MNTSMIILIIIVLLLLGATFMLFFRNMAMNEKLKKLKNTNQKVNSLSILQDFIGVISDGSIASNEKMNKINNILIEKYEIKYSTIVMFNGLEYKVEATNVNEKQWEVFETLHENDIFRESIDNATPRYITVNQNEKLPYLQMEFERAKSAIFYPLYIDNVYIGCWLIEGNKSHEFDNIDITILDVIKNNLIASIRCLKDQKVLENMDRTDKVSGLKMHEFLYSSPRKIIDKYPTSIVSLIRIINFQQIEDKISKKTANSVFKHIAEYINKSLAPEYFCVKYDDDKIAIVFSGSDLDGVAKFVEDLKLGIERIKVKTFASLNESMNGLAVAPKLNIALTTYYKETALEEALKALCDYLESAPISESDISCL